MKKKNKQKEIQKRKEEKSKDRITKKQQRRNKKEILEVDEHEVQNLNKELEPLGLQVKLIKGDGNCLFRSVADQLDGDQSKHNIYRQKTVQFITSQKEMFEPFIYDETFEEYCTRMEEDGEWAGNIELQAISLCYNVNIKVYQVNAPTLQLLNTKGKTIHLSYHNGEHYNSVVPISDTEVLKLHDINFQNNLITKNERIIMESTGINDLELIKKVLTDHWNDVNATIDFLITQKYQKETKETKPKVEVEMTNTEKKIMNLTGLNDVKMIKKIYEDMGNDLDASVDYIKMNWDDIEKQIKKESENTNDEDEFLNDYVNKVMELTQYFDYDRIVKLLNDKKFDLDTVINIILNEEKEKSKKKQLTNKEKKIQQKKEDEESEKVKKMMEKTKTVNI